MDILVALLAFAGVMALLSTLLSVVIEGVHRAFDLRRSGLEEMLRALHSDVLTRLNPAAASIVDASSVSPPPSSREAVHFAKEMTKNPTFAGQKRFWWLRNIPVVNFFFRKRHERLSTLQFVEQLAGTEVGRSLANLPRGQLKRALTAAAYQFERYGEAQSSYFQSRARVLSVLASVAFAFAANVDALHVYRVLASEQTVRDLAIEAARDVDSGARAAPKNVAELRELGLPIGYAAYPFCVGAEDAAKDERCVSSSARASISPYSPNLNLADARTRVFSSRQGWLWLASVLVAGGLIGLGAPFWFQVFRRLARVAPAAQSVRAAVVPDSAPTPSPARGTEAVRDPNAATPDALLLAYDVASGQVARSVADPSVTTSLDTLAAAQPSVVIHGDGAVTRTGPGLSRHLR